MSDILNDNREAVIQEYLELRDRVICKICHENYVADVFLPCSHLVCCADCAPVCRTCPECKKKVDRRIPVKI
ncbi:baculoviral IAP repeat-containing protein 8-like [Crassostrea virginica]